MPVESGIGRPSILENREFVDLTEDEINALTGQEERKMTGNCAFDSCKSQVQDTLGSGGRWEKHWIALDPSGRRVFADIYYKGDLAVAVACDGEVIKEFRAD